MNPEQELVSSLTVHSKYARFWKELGRREVFEEIVARNRQMHITHLDSLPTVSDKQEARRLLDWAFSYVRNREVMPSMRSMQFGGDAILENNIKIYNCAARRADSVDFFAELMYLLLCGTGAGYSVQKQHVAALPAIKEVFRWGVHVVEDSIEGWADAVRAVTDAYFLGRDLPVSFDYSMVRPKGTLIRTSGGKAPGPEPLAQTVNDLIALFESIEPGAKLRPIQAHDASTYIARAVLSGGIRRSAMIALFSPDDDEMLNAKMGEWWLSYPDRAYANNSAILVRGKDDHLFPSVFGRARASGSGEPGILWVDDEKYLTNPCSEITLNHKQFCNLTTINAGTVRNQEDFNNRARAAGIIGTFQASYTDFPYLSDGWRRQTQEEALLGVSMTGIAAGAIDHLDAAEAVAHAVTANAEVAALLGINPAARVTAIKPEGTASLVLGTASGIHAWHDDYYVRRMRFNKSEPVSEYLIGKFGISAPESSSILEQDSFNPEQIVVSLPQAAPLGAVTRDEGAMGMLGRVKRYTREWIEPGNVYGGMRNNISATVNIRQHEWDSVYDWMWNNRYEYNGLSLLPYSDHTYVQAPYETIDRERFENMSAAISAARINLTEVVEFTDNTNLAMEAACAGGACEWNP